MGFRHGSLPAVRSAAEPVAAAAVVAEVEVEAVGAEPRAQDHGLGEAAVHGDEHHEPAANFADGLAINDDVGPADALQ